MQENTCWLLAAEPFDYFPPERRTCAARVVAHSQRVSVVVRVHREEADSEGAVLGVRGAVFKVFQVDAELVVALDGQGVDLLQPCSRRQTNKQRESVSKVRWQRSQGKVDFKQRISASSERLPLRGCGSFSAYF